MNEQLADAVLREIVQPIINHRMGDKSLNVFDWVKEHAEADDTVDYRDEWEDKQEELLNAARALIQARKDAAEATGS